MHKAIVISARCRRACARIVSCPIAQDASETLDQSNPDEDFEEAAILRDEIKQTTARLTSSPAA